MSAGVAWQGVQEVLGDARATIDASISELQAKGKSEITILVLGKRCVGKSSTINTLLGEPGLRPTEVFAPAPDKRIAEVRRSVGSFTIRVIDTPGLIDCGMVDLESLQSIVGTLVGRCVDVLLYVDRLDTYRVESTDRQLASAITSHFGRKIWRHAVLVLTRAQIPLPDRRSFDEFVDDRAKPLKELLRSEGKLGRKDVLQVAVLENVASRWRKNEDGEKILPNGSVWYPTFLESVLAAALERDAVKVTEKMVAGPNLNNGFKFFIPVIALVQFFLIFRPLKQAIEFDKSQADRRRPKWEVEAEVYRRSNSAAMARRRVAQFRQQQAQKK